MGDGGHNTRLKSLDDATKLVNEQLAAHSKNLENITVTLQGQQTLFHDILSQLTHLQPPPAPPFTVQNSSPIFPGQTSNPTAQPQFYSPLQPHNIFPQSPSQTLPVNPLALFRRDKPATIDLPKFDGSNAESWIFQANQYFDHYSVPNEQRLSIISFYLEGLARE